VSADAVRWRTKDAALMYGDALSISFQRYLIANAPCLPQIPQSLGALLPAATGPTSFLVPLHEGEGVWIAVEFGAGAPALDLKAKAGPKVQAWRLSAQSPGKIELIAGAKAGRGELRFTASALNIVEAAAGRAAKAVVELVAPDEFERRTGTTAPARAKAEDGYGGWRLP
jgi:hypothetical protein